LRIEPQPDLTQIILPTIQYVGALEVGAVNNVPNLQVLAMPALTQVAGTLGIGLESLTAIDFSSLESVHSLTLGFLKLSDLGTFSKLKMLPGDLYLYGDQLGSLAGLETALATTHGKVTLDYDAIDDLSALGSLQQ